MLGSSSTTRTLTAPLVALTQSLCESNLGVCWERQLRVRDAEGVDEGGGVGPGLLAQVVDRLQDGLGRRGRELPVLLEPAAVLLHVPQHVEAAQLVQHLL